ncbi:antiviral reverse transcriptase Drt3a [Methylomonas sp. YC3]
MHDQTFSKKSLERMFQKRDFIGLGTPHDQEIFREKILSLAVDSANISFGKISNPLIKFQLGGKAVFKFCQLSDELIARKLCANIKRSFRSITVGRSQIVGNLRLLLEEGIPFRVYRLDIKSFYESFEPSYVLFIINNLHRLSPHSKTLMQNLLSCHASLGGKGVPRGLSLSAPLSDLLMHSFDMGMQSNEDVFFYSRYVDDIILITSARETATKFVRDVKKLLPPGLSLNQYKRNIESADKQVSPKKSSDLDDIPLFCFDYLGYAFLIREPQKDSKTRPGDHYRSVTVDVAAKKVTRFKTRIARSFIDFSKTGDFVLLKDRIKFLTKNFSVYNAKAGGKKIAGIFHSYPLISNDANALRNLDYFLKNAVISKSGRIFSKSSLRLSAKQKRELLAHSFVRGHAERQFVYFSGSRLKEIQKCWKN